uniref:Uncharacterized protein n=1 Tax=Leersia perrieri TaxID=77586 RepID=A0A0D9XN62_9ORYZ
MPSAPPHLSPPAAAASIRRRRIHLRRQLLAAAAAASIRTATAGPVALRCPLRSVFCVVCVALLTLLLRRHPSRRRATTPHAAAPHASVQTHIRLARRHCILQLHHPSPNTPASLESTSGYSAPLAAAPVSV